MLRRLLMLALLWPPIAMAWSDHAGLSWPMVRTIPAMNRGNVEVEALDAFLLANQLQLVDALADYERWAENAEHHCPPTPDALRFRVGDPADITDRFLAAIRVNPDLPYRLYRQGTPEEADVSPEPIPWPELSFLNRGSARERTLFIPLATGATVSPAQVLTSASDEPDLGMDVGLFADNGTGFGRRYGFGVQPFGNANLDYSSQAPFHMGFYHLNALVTLAQPNLTRTFPHCRIALYQRLATLAFQTGHDYWGWRFAGWGLHYIGDLTQPYHATPMPGMGTLTLLWWVVQGRTDEAVRLVSNRHGVLESWQFQRLANALGAGDWSGQLLSSLVIPASRSETMSPDTVYALARESVQVADQLDDALLATMPERFVSDPEFEWVGSGYEDGLVDRVIDHHGQSAVGHMDDVLIDQFERFARYSRGWIEYMLGFADAGGNITGPGGE